MMKRLPLFIILVLIFSCLLGCSEKENSSLIRIDSPDDLPTQLWNEVFFLHKNVNSHGIITIQKLDKSTFNVYKDFSYIPDIDVSPDGSRVVFSQMTVIYGKKQTALYLVNLGENTKEKVLYLNKDYRSIMLLEPSFSSDGLNVYFSISNFEDERHQIGILEINGANFQTINPNIPLAITPKPSRNGLQILVTCAGIDPRTKKPCFQLCLIDKSGIYMRHISREGDVLNGYIFSPDNSKIIFSEMDFGLLRRTKYRLCVVDTDTYEKSVILEWEGYINRISSDGKTIIFVGRPHKRMNHGVYLIDIDGSNLSHLAYFDDFMKDWYEDIEG